MGTKQRNLVTKQVPKSIKMSGFNLGSAETPLQITTESCLDVMVILAAVADETIRIDVDV